MMQFYHDCKFEKLLVTLGKRLNRLSGFAEMVVNMTFRYFEVIDNEEWQEAVE